MEELRQCGYWVLGRVEEGVVGLDRWKLKTLTFIVCKTAFRLVRVLLFIKPSRRRTERHGGSHHPFESSIIFPGDYVFSLHHV